MNAQLDWKPPIGVDLEWVQKKMEEYRPGARYAILDYGTVVFFGPGEKPTLASIYAKVSDSVRTSRDFKVRRSADGNYLVTFRGGIGALVDGGALEGDFDSISSDALKHGLFPNESFAMEEIGAIQGKELVAGIIARALLHRDLLQISEKRSDH